MRRIGTDLRHVALFPSAFSPSLGGVEELTRQLALQQIHRGDRPTVVTMRWPKSLPANEQVDGIDVYRQVFRTPEWHWRFLAGWMLTSKSIQSRVEGILRQRDCSLVHVQCVSGNGYYAYRAARALRLPLVVSLQGEITMDATGIYQRSRVLPRLLRRLFLEADAITACSRQTLDEAIAFTGCDPGERASVVYNGVALDEFRAVEPIDRERPYMLAIGRHVEQKGFDVLLRAFAQACTDPDFTLDLVLAGDGPSRPCLEALGRVLHVAHRVDFVGRCDRRRTAALFAGCEYFVLPSRQEPMGIVNLEAMAAGRAVIASRVGGVPELVQHEVTGILVAPCDVVELAGAMLRLARSPAASEQMGARGRRAAERFAWPRIADEYEDVYANAAERSKARYLRHGDTRTRPSRR